MKNLSLPETYVELTENECNSVEGGSSITPLPTISGIPTTTDVRQLVDHWLDTARSNVSSPSAQAGIDIGKGWADFGLNLASIFMFPVNLLLNPISTIRSLINRN